MRKFLTWLILAFAEFATSVLGPTKRIQVRVRVRDRLEADLPVSTQWGRILFCDLSNRTFARLRCYRDYEPDMLCWLDAMPENGRLWDIGGNLGTFTLYAAFRLKGEGVRVVAFEPGASSYAALNRNIEQNGMANHVVAYCIALADSTRVDRLNMPATWAGGDFNGFGTEISVLDQAIDTKFRQGAVGFAIDDFVDLFTPPLPTHVKLDVDGIEAEILRGGRRTLSAESVQSMIVEIEGDLNSDRNREIFYLMAELGFSARSKANPAHRNVVFDKNGKPF